MSRNAARAMRDLAECLEEEAADMPTGMAYATIAALARAHRKAADRIEAWSGDVGQGNGPVTVPEEYRGKGAGHKR
jgi:hypothetical protein